MIELGSVCAGVSVCASLIKERVREEGGKVKENKNGEEQGEGGMFFIT